MRRHSVTSFRSSFRLESRIRRHPSRQVDQRTLDFPRRVGTADDHLLVADSSLEKRLSSGDCHAFATTSGTPPVQYSSPSALKRYFATCDRFFRHDLHSSTTFHLMSTTLTTSISSVRHIRTLTHGASMLGRVLIDHQHDKNRKWSPASDRRHPLATSDFKRDTVPPVSMPPNQRSSPDSSIAFVRAIVPYAARRTCVTRD